VSLQTRKSIGCVYADFLFDRHFGKSNSLYDFGGVNLTQSREKCRELEAQQKSMGRKINNKVMGTLDK
jgi:structural maintenance of chromosome 2